MESAQKASEANALKWKEFLEKVGIYQFLINLKFQKTELKVVVGFSSICGLGLFAAEDMNRGEHEAGRIVTRFAFREEATGEIARTRFSMDGVQRFSGLLLWRF